MALIRRPWLLVTAFVVTAVAVAPPIGGWADELLLGHMAQHLVLAVVVPLLAAGGLRRPTPVGGGRLALVTAAHVGTLAVWHLPALYDGAVDSSRLHAVEHLTMLAGGLAFWPLVLVSPGGLLALFTAGLGSGALAALLTLSPRPLYQAHLVSAPAHGLTALGDQQLAGAVMWVPGGLVYAGVAVALLLRWLAREPAPDTARPWPAATGFLGWAPTASLLPLALLGAVALTVAGCGATAVQRSPVVPFGDPGQGAEAISAYGCGSCHEIPGIRRADGLVGPPLDRFGRRSFIAGELPNTPDNLVTWVMDPQAVEPGTAMPNLDVTEADARDIAAYLESLT
ncbi:MAG: cytochrome c oxidase assembly protein [Acidimicrobiales bacterium]